MNCKSRVYAALKFQETPFVPYAFGCTPPVWSHLRQHYSMQDPFIELGMHILAVEPKPSINPCLPPSPSGEEVDEFGVRWRESPYGSRYPVAHPLTRPSLAGYSFPDPEAPGRFSHIPAIITNHSDRFIVACIDNTLFERAWFLRGFEELLSDMVITPDFVHNLLDRILAFDLVALAKMLRFPVDGVWFADDYAHQGELLMSPAMWRTFIKPRLACLIQRAKLASLPVFLHSDGAVTSLIPDLLEIGLNALNPLQPEVMDLVELKRQYGGELCFCGGISTQHVLCSGRPEDVETELRGTVRTMAHGGGYIVATAGRVQTDVPLPNLIRLLDLLRCQDKEPLN